MARPLVLRIRLGEPAQGPPRVPAARGRDAGSVAVRRSFSSGTEPGEPRRARRGAGRNRKEARSVKEILSDVARWRKRGEKVAIATVVATRRSAPRPVGAKLAVSESGELAGSVSGGRVESDVSDDPRRVAVTGRAEPGPHRDPHDGA